MRKRPPATVWLSFALLIGVIAVATWQAIQIFESLPLTVDDPDAVGKAGLAMALTLGALWLFEGVPAILMLFGVNLWRMVVTIAAVPGLLALIFYHQPGGWGPLLLTLKLVQLCAVALLYVGPSRAFFRANGVP